MGSRRVRAMADPWIWKATDEPARRRVVVRERVVCRGLNILKRT